MTLYCHHPSPIGQLLLVGDPGPGGGLRLRGLYMDEHRRGPEVGAGWRESPAEFAAVIRQLDEYFAGRRKAFELDLAPVGTPFQLAVWEALRSIPPGTTTTYGALADRIGRHGAARAVGAAVGRNPISVIVPCHRVVGSDGSLTGFAGGIARKRALLALEGALAGDARV